jgi:peptidoglycan hydrolase CwlO-like protein
MQLKKHTPDWSIDRPIVLRQYRDWLGLIEGDDRYILEPSSTSIMDEPTPLRRSKRRCSAVSPVKPITETARPDDVLPAQTPSGRSKKRVRFSAPTPLNTTGLTPAIGRSSLSTPLRSVSSPLPRSVEYQFTPFRQVLTQRLRRRISRNGLSAEMNEYEAERKDKARLEREVGEKDEELKKLRGELESRRGDTHEEQEDVESSQQIDEVEAELEALRRSFNEFDYPPAEDGIMEDNDIAIDWSQLQNTRPANPQQSTTSTILIHEDATALPPLSPTFQPDIHLLSVALELESAKKEKRRLFHSVRRHIDAPGTSLSFADSPGRSQLSFDSLASLPSPPGDFYQNLSKTLKATTARAETAEEALMMLEEEVKGLGFPGDNGSEAVGEVARHFREARLELERAIPGETSIGFENEGVLPALLGKLKGLLRGMGEREAELRSLREQHRSLKGNFEHAIRGVEREGVKVKELEEAIERASGECLFVRMRVQEVEGEVREREASIERLVQALERYRGDVRRLEGLISGMEAEAQVVVSEHAQTVSDLEAKITAETTGRRAAESSAVERLARITELEAALTSANDSALKIDAQLHRLQRSTIATVESHGQQLGSLNARIASLGTALASANAEVDKLKVIKGKLEGRVRFEVEQGQGVVEAMQGEVERALIKASERRKGYVRGAKVRVANSEIEMGEEDLGSDGVGPMTPASLVRFVDVEERDGEGHVEGSVEVRRGKMRGLGLRRGKGKGGRRSYDSGIGMDTLSEDELEQAFEDSDGEVMTPELSSEPDFETGLGVHVG